MVSDHYASSKASNQGGDPIRAKWGRIVLLCVAAAIILPITAFIAREAWRAHALLAFCKAARPGITVADLLALESRYSIDDSYLVQANFGDYIDQASSRGLEFRSHMYDPDFACDIGHDGEKVTHVQLLGLEESTQ